MEKYPDSRFLALGLLRFFGLPSFTRQSDINASDFMIFWNSKNYQKMENSEDLRSNEHFYDILFVTIEP